MVSNMNSEQPSRNRLSSSTASSVALSLTTCTAVHAALTNEVRSQLDSAVFGAGLVSQVFVRFPLWLGYYLDADLRTAKACEQAQLWVIPRDTDQRRPDCYFRKSVQQMDLVPFQWRAVFSPSGGVQIYSDRCILGKEEALRFAAPIADVLATAVALYVAQHPGAANA